MHSHTHIHTHKSVMWSFWNISNYYSLTIFWWILRESVVLYPAPTETRTALPETGKWPQRGGSWCWWEKQVWLVYRPASRPSMEEHASGSCSVGNGGEEKGQADTDTGTFPEETARHLRSHWKGQCFTRVGNQLQTVQPSSQMEKKLTEAQRFGATVSVAYLWSVIWIFHPAPQDTNKTFKLSFSRNWLSSMTGDI